MFYCKLYLLNVEKRSRHNDFLKNICQIEHLRHRSIANFIVNIISGLVAYFFLPKKPSLHILQDFSPSHFSIVA